jgi:mannose-6-phosphate isomerase-like protein (cupin superfamily)
MSSPSPAPSPSLRTWGAQRLLWAERLRGCALTWPAGKPWFTNDPLDHAPHSHPGASELYFVATGALEVVVGREELTLAAGEMCLIPPGAYHDPRGTRGSDLGLFCVVAPNWRHRRWRTEGFDEAAFSARAQRARTDMPGPLPSDDLLQIDCLELPPGEQQDEPPQRGRERVLYVLAGELDLAIDGMRGRFSAHEYAHVPSNAHHRLASAGAGPLLLLSVWSTDPDPAAAPA